MDSIHCVYAYTEDWITNTGISIETDIYVYSIETPDKVPFITLPVQGYILYSYISNLYPVL